MVFFCKCCALFCCCRQRVLANFIVQHRSKSCCLQTVFDFIIDTGFLRTASSGDDQCFLTIWFRQFACFLYLTGTKYNIDRQEVRKVDCRCLFFFHFFGTDSFQCFLQCCCHCIRLGIQLFYLYIDMRSEFFFVF